MTLELVIAGAVLGALALYAIFGGADYGVGVWDLLASGPRTRAQRALLETAIGPIWEAQHVWLILAVVVLFTAFPRAYAFVSIALFTPLTILLFGIVLRGSAFTFRHYTTGSDAMQRRWGLVFSVSSIVTPVMLGAIVGALSSGQPWWSAFPLAVGVFALALFSMLSAVYLTVDAEDDALREDFRHRALGAALVVGALALCVFLLAESQAPRIREGLSRRPWSIPLHAFTAISALTVYAALWRRRFRMARAAAAMQALGIVLGWGASQYPWVAVPGPALPGLALTEAAAPRSTLVVLAWSLAAGSVLLFPSLYALYRIFKGERPFSILERPRAGHVKSSAPSDGKRQV